MNVPAMRASCWLSSIGTSAGGIREEVGAKQVVDDGIVQGDVGPHAGRKVGMAVDDAGAGERLRGTMQDRPRQVTAVKSSLIGIGSVEKKFCICHREIGGGAT